MENLKREERLIYPPTVVDISNQKPDGSYGKKPYCCYVHARQHHKVGDELFSSAGSPGMGHLIQVITRMDDTGVYGYVKENTMRVLEPSDCI